MGIEYSIVYSKRKTLRIIVERDRSVVVRAPLNTELKKIERIVEQKTRWINAKINDSQKYSYVPEEKEFVSGESILYLGKSYSLYVVDDEIAGVKFDGKFYISEKNQPIAGPLFRDWYMKSANDVIVPKAVQIAKQIGVNYNKIDIQDIQFRWGSCTPKDNIHLNWRLIKAPMNVVEYIIVHELTHLLERNHSQEFWNRVRSAYPLYPVARKWLADFGGELEVDF